MNFEGVTPLRSYPVGVESQFYGHFLISNSEKNPNYKLTITNMLTEKRCKLFFLIFQCCSCALLPAQEASAEKEPEVIAQEATLVKPSVKQDQIENPPVEDIKDEIKALDVSEVQKITSTPEPTKNPIIENLGEILPWVLIVFLSAFSGALVAWVIMLQKQGVHFKALRRTVLEGGEKIPLLNEEAFNLIRGFKEEWQAYLQQFKADADSHREQVNASIAHAQIAANEAQNLTMQVVDDFRNKLKTELPRISDYMRVIAGEATAAREESSKTMEYSKQVGELIHKKEDEIKELQKGYQHSLLGPLVNCMLSVRDEIKKISVARSDDHEISAYLQEFEGAIIEALQVIGIRELEIELGKDPREIATHHWDSVPACITTDQVNLNGKIASVAKPGYMMTSPSGVDTVLRKALLLRYKHEPEQPTGNESPDTIIQNTSTKND